MKTDKKATGRVQQTLDGALEKVSEVKTFTRDGTTHAIAQFVACDDQVSVCVSVVQRVDTDIVGPGSCPC
jgi:predicted secreted protein